LEWLIYIAIVLAVLAVLVSFLLVLALFIGPPHDTFDVDIKTKDNNTNDKR
jgi:hypothetical protein